MPCATHVIPAPLRNESRAGPTSMAPVQLAQLAPATNSRIAMPIAGTLAGFFTFGGLHLASL